MLNSDWRMGVNEQLCLFERSWKGSKADWNASGRWSTALDTFILTMHLAQCLDCNSVFIETHYGNTAPGAINSDLAPPDFFLFLRIKMKLKDSTLGLWNLAKKRWRGAWRKSPSMLFRGAFSTLYKCRHWCSDAEGNYFEEF